MNKALVIVHADHPYYDFCRDEYQFYLATQLYKSVKKSLNKKQIYFVATVQNEVPEYLIDFLDKIKLVSYDINKGDYYQLFKCKDVLLKNKYSEVELAGSYYQACVQNYYKSLNNFQSYFQSDEWLSNFSYKALSGKFGFSEDRIKEIVKTKINVRINGELTDFVIKRFLLDDDKFIKEAEEYNLSNITIQSKIDFKEYLKNASHLIHTPQPQMDFKKEYLKIYSK